MKEENEIINRLAEADSGLAFEPDPSFIAELVMGEQPRTPLRWFRKPIAAGVLLAAALTGTALAAGMSGPGDALFGLKAATQNVLASSTADGLEEAERLLDLAETRISEARAAKASGDGATVEGLLELAEGNIDSAVEAVDGTEHEDPIRIRAEALRDEIKDLRAPSPTGDDDHGDDDNRRGPTPSPSPSADDDHSGPGGGGDEPDEPDNEPSPSPTESEEPHPEETDNSGSGSSGSGSSGSGSSGSGSSPSPTDTPELDD